MKIYFAGPLFTSAEQAFNSRVVELLRSYGHHVFLPQEYEQRPEKTNARSIFLFDRDSILWSDVVVANMDGSDPDSGTCWEVGYAYQKRPIILFRTDIRAEKDFGPYNLMLHQSATKVLHIPGAHPDMVAFGVHETIKELEL